MDNHICNQIIPKTSLCSSMYNYEYSLTPSCAIYHFLLFSTRSSNRDHGSQRVNDRAEFAGERSGPKNKARCPPIYLFRTAPLKCARATLGCFQQ